MTINTYHHVRHTGIGDPVKFTPVGRFSELYGILSYPLVLSVLGGR